MNINNISKILTKHIMTETELRLESETNQNEPHKTKNIQ